VSKFSIELPLNPTGLGNVGVGVAMELFERGLTPNVFPIGGIDLSFAPVTEQFAQWLQYCINKALKSQKRSEPNVKIWHIQGANQSILSDNNTLYTVHELDKLTDEEVNICGNYDRVAVPSNFSKTIFNSYGLNSTSIPNFFDGRIFFNTPVKKKGLEDVTIFGLFGKMEKRKATLKTIAAWCKKFGKNKKYRLHCHVFNPFLMQAHKVDPKNGVEFHRQYIQQNLGFELPWNVSIFGFQNPQEFNLSLNVIDIDLGLSGGEGFGLPLFTTRCLNKKAVVLRAHAFEDYCSDENSVWVEPNGKESAEDGMFFHKGGPFNQGDIFTWDEDEAIAAMEKAIEMPNPDESVGLALREKFSVKNTVDSLLNF